MKKLLTIAVLIGAISTAEAQNTFPSTGNAGIGITIPAYKLDVGPSSPADGIRITQLSSGSSALHLSNVSSGGHGTYGNMWSFYSSGSSDSWMGGLGNFAISKTSTGGSINTAPGTNLPNFFIQGLSGNVGVNTISPANRLEVAVSTGGDGIKISQTTSGSAALHLNNQTAAGHLWSIYSLGTGDGWPGAPGSFAIQDVNGDPSNPRLFMSGASGNLGLKTTSPPRTLSVYGDAIIGKDFNQTGTGVGNFEIVTDGSAPIRRGISINPTGGAVNFYTYGGPADAVFSFKNVLDANHNLMTISVTGQVIIGSQTSQSHPTAKFQVNGTAACQELFVTATTDWADYVFDKSYKLMSLDKLNSFITENHHLPNVPSASEIKKNDLNLGEMSKIQMEKIEELTLYILELKKEIEELKKEKH